MDVFSYVRERNSTYIHTFQHKNIQPFTREKRLGGVHSHKHFSKPMGTFWKESTVPTSLLLERAEIAQQMGDSGWFLAAHRDNSTEFGCTVFPALPCPPAQPPAWAHPPLGVPSRVAEEIEEIKEIKQWR